MKLPQRQLAVSGPNDYEESSRQLGSELGRWGYQEFSPGTHLFKCLGDQMICVMRGRSTIGNISLQPGTSGGSIGTAILRLAERGIVSPKEFSVEPMGSRPRCRAAYRAAFES